MDDVSKEEPTKESSSEESEKELKPPAAPQPPGTFGRRGLEKQK